MNLRSFFTVCFCIVLGIFSLKAGDPIKTISISSPQAISIICPPSISTPCLIQSPYPSFEVFEDEGGGVTLTGSSVLNETSFSMLSEVSQGSCIVHRTYVVSDQAGSSTTCRQVITITGDNVNPVARCKPVNVRLGGNIGNVTLNVTDLDNGSTDNCGIHTIVSDKNLLIGCNDIGTVVTYVLTVTDRCGNTNTCSSTITPSSCPPDVNRAINANCGLVIPNLTSPITTFMPCQRPVTIVTQSPLAGTILSNLIHNQAIPITFMISNNAGLAETCTINIIAKDSIKPIVTCKIQPLRAITGILERPDTLFNMINDNCSVIRLTYSMRRLGNDCNGMPDDLGSYVVFCCSDVSRPLSLIVRATDQNGNTAECTRVVNVRDITAPVIEAGSLPDITISCEYPLNLNNLTAFGTLVAIGSMRNNIVIADPGNPIYPTGIAGRDGVFSNCDGGLVTVLTRSLLDNCNLGQIKRDFTVTDLSGNKSTYTQTITVQDRRPFTVNDIIWPQKNVTFNSCSSVTPTPTITGSPKLTSDKCTLAAPAFTDQKFTNNICGFIKRTWTVIDWCQYKANVPNSPGKWTFVQNITYSNSVKPTFTGRTCRDTIICVATNCLASITLNATATDDCIPLAIVWSYSVDLGNNGTNDVTNGSTNSYTNTALAIGKHAIHWKVTDRCNNVSTCKSIITVKDCAAPTVVLRNGLAANLTTAGNVTIWANDFVLYGSDNCTAANLLKYSFTNNVLQTSKTYTCANKGNNPVEIWVTDIAGNQLKVNTVINIQDNGGVCPNIIDNNVALRAINDANNLIEISELAPNPYIDIISTNINVAKESTAFWTVWDVDGKIICTNNVQLQIGQNQVIIDESTKGILPGIYFCKLSVNSTEKVFRMIKMK
jgi:hypothetical protein